MKNKISTSLWSAWKILAWCRNAESNRGPTDYESVALPTELSRLRRFKLLPDEELKLFSEILTKIRLNNKFNSIALEI